MVSGQGGRLLLLFKNVFFRVVRLETCCQGFFVLVRHEVCVLRGEGIPVCVYLGGAMGQEVLPVASPARELLAGCFDSWVGAQSSH